jgi:hypothetical protein
VLPRLYGAAGTVPIEISPDFVADVVGTILDGIGTAG